MIILAHLVDSFRQTDLLHLSPDDLNLIREPVGLNNFLGRLNYATHVHSNHLELDKSILTSRSDNQGLYLGGSSLGAEHREDSSTASNIKDHLD